MVSSAVSPRDEREADECVRRVHQFENIGMLLYALSCPSFPEQPRPTLIVGRRFVVAVSEYNQTLFEDSRQNRLDESLELWEMISASRWFGRSTFVLFVSDSRSLRWGGSLTSMECAAEQDGHL